MSQFVEKRSDRCFQQKESDRCSKENYENSSLEKKPEKRYQSMTDFAKAIEDVKNTFPTEAVKRNLKDELDDRNVFKKMIDYVNDIDFMF